MRASGWIFRNSERICHRIGPKVAQDGGVCGRDGDAAMAEREEDGGRGRVAQAAGIAFLVAGTLGVGVLLYVQSTRLLICYETNTTLPDAAYVDIMIRDIVKNGDHGGRAYANRLDYLGDRTECCTIERVAGTVAEGRTGKREIAVSAKYFNTARKDYFLIERRYDACGHASAKPLTAG